MWEVIKRVSGKETIVAGPLNYSAAYAAYEPLADKYNETDKDGNYTHPNVRVSIRKVPA